MSSTKTKELTLYVQHDKEDPPLELQVDPSHSINQILKQLNKPHGDLSIVYRNRLLSNQEASFTFYNIENESTLYTMKKSVNLSIQSSSNKILDIIQVSPHLTIQSIQDQLQSYHHLVYNGVQIEKEGEKTLYELGIHDDVIIYIQDTIVIINNSQKQQQKKKKKGRCAYLHCSDKVCKMIGDCRYCQSAYCSRHRLPEAHTCINLTSCKQVAHERNSVKLLSERCVASKI